MANFGCDPGDLNDDRRSPMTKFPLIDSCGLPMRRVQLDKQRDIWTETMVYAEDLEAFLQQAPVVYGRMDNDFLAWLDHNQSNNPKNTHSARLICVQEIKPVTAEDILRQIVDSDNGLVYTRGNTDVWKSIPNDLMEKAKRYLENK